MCRAALLESVTLIVIARENQFIYFDLHQRLGHRARGRFVVNASENSQKGHDSDEGKRDTPLHEDL